MSAAHLHAVPDPDDVPPAPAAGAEPGEGAAVVEVLDAPPAAGEEERQAVEAGPDAGEPGEETAPRRALALPDLRPYVTADRETARELGALAADAARTTAPRIRRGLAPVLRAVWRLVRAGTVVVLLVVRAWFAGELAPKVPPLWRLLLGPLLLLYGVGQTVVLYPWAPLLLVPAWPLLAITAQRWAAGHADRAAKASGKRSKGSPKEVSKGTGKTFTTRLAAALAKASPPAPAEASAEPAPASPAEPGQEAAGEHEETPAPALPAAPSRDDLVRALHALVGGSSGVLHTALRDRLRYPSTRAVREALDAAGIRRRDGVRAVGGNGPGVHRRDIPPLPPPREGAPEAGVVAGEEGFTNNNNAGEGPGEGLGVDGSDPGPAYPFDVLPDPERGPSAWRVVPRD